MKTLFQLAVIAVFFVTGSLAYSQQTQTAPAGDSALVQAAKKEKERREKLKISSKPTKTFTNQDIEDFKIKNKEYESSTPSEETAEETEAPVEESSSAADASAQAEENWRKRSRAAADRIKAAEEKIEKTQTDINALTQAFYAESDGVAQRGQIEAERTTRLNQLEAAKKELEAAKQAQEDLIDEARRSSVPPGWIEE